MNRLMDRKIQAKHASTATFVMYVAEGGVQGGGARP